ncbi:hypothetical protein [Haloferax profundi]|uniref:Uncharacterized protein n=1 Tax=Haloferax profundi TaxID=1544718 RepID=A0A0W1SSF0_9EURY|nr:hypothetical protein [Haloferax profundi]KTG29390.1 hypothetical protein AUR66_10340 [Haloferax profundi]
MPSDSLSAEERRQYDVVYHATKNAIWDVLGTAVYLLFLVFGVSIAVFALVLPAVGALAQGDANVVVLGVGFVGLVVAAFGVYRVYTLVR